MMKSVCGYCGVGCGIEIHNGTLKGDRTYPVSKGLLCAKGASSLSSVNTDARLLHSQSRLTLHDDFSAIEWSTAIDMIAEKITATTADRVGLYLSGQLLSEDYYVANKLGKGFIGTNNVDTNSRMCMSSAVVAHKKAFGADYVPVRMDDIEHCNLLILVGSNAAEAHVVLSNKIKKAKKKGLKVVVIDPRETMTAEYADLYLPIRPGSDIDFFNLVAGHLIQEGMADLDYIDAHVNGYERYAEAIGKLPASELLTRCGIAPEKFEAFMTLFGSSENIITAWTMGINQSVQGVEKNLSIINMHLISGKINKAGNGPFSLTGQPNAMGGREVGGLSTMLAVHLDFDEASIAKVSDFWGTENIDNRAGLSAFEMVEAAERGELDLLIISHTDPIYHLPNRNRVEAAFKKIPFIIEINAYDDSETKPFSHLRLPAAPWGEKEGIQTNMDRTITRQEKLVETSGEAKPDWEIFSMIGRKLGFQEAFAYKNAAEIFEEFKAMTKLSKEAHLDIYRVDQQRLKTEPYVWGENLFGENRFLTANGKANLHMVESKNESEQRSPHFPFILLTGRIRDQWHSGTKTGLIEKLKKHKPDSFVEINSSDAASLHIQDGEHVEVSTLRGRVTLPAKVTDNIREKTIFIPVTERQVNYLTNDLLDPLSKEPDFNHAAATISKSGDQ